MQQANKIQIAAIMLRADTLRNKSKAANTQAKYSRGAWASIREPPLLVVHAAWGRARQAG